MGKVDDAAIVVVAAADPERGERGQAAGDVDSEEPAGEPPCPAARQVEMALAIAIEEAAPGQVTVTPEAKKNIVVSVEDPLHRSSRRPSLHCGLPR